MRYRRSNSPQGSSSLSSLPGWAVYSLMALFVVTIVGLGYLTFSSIKKMVSNAPIGADSGFQFQGGGPADGAPNQIEGEPTLEPDFIEGRITILILGIDERQTEQGPWRTDTMILMTVDPVNRTAGMLSIPRDLWVSIPDYGVYDRINTAHFRGDGDQYPGGGGPALAMNTVQHNFGRPVDYYASVNFQAFTGVIDQIGCIPITVSETINDEKYPDGANGYDPFYIEAGNYCLEGETLLKYARTRATYGGDFDRAARQQQVIYAIRDHVLSTDQLPLLIARAPELYGTVADGVRTNLSLPQMIALARLVAEIPNGNICSAVITGEYVELETLSDGSQVLIPDRDKVRSLVNQVFDGEGECAAGTLSLADQALSEGATISILNGTRQEGLATATRDIITGGGLSVAFIGNAERFDYTQTQILSYTGKTATAQYIASLLGLPPSSVISSRDGTEYDILVILGEDYLP